MRRDNYKAQGTGLRAQDGRCGASGAGRRTNLRVLSLLFVPCVMCFVPFCFAEDIRDIRGPVALRSDWWWVLILVAIVALAGLVWGGVVLLRQRRKKAAVPVPPKPAWQVAYEALDRLEGSGLISEGRIKEYYALLSDIVRQYIEGRFAIRAPEMTTQEFMDKARFSTSLSDGQKIFLRDFLDASDMVKFAKFVPSFDHMKEALRFARRFVDETKPELVSAHGI